MEDKTNKENSSEVISSDTDNQVKWERIKDLLFGSEFDTVIGEIRSTNNNLDTVDEKIRSEIKDIRGFIVNTIRYEMELLSQDVISKEITTEGRLSSINTILEQLENRINNLEEKLSQKEETQKNIQKSLDSLNKTLKQIAELRIMKYGNR